MPVIFILNSPENVRNTDIKYKKYNYFLEDYHQKARTPHFL